MLPQTAPSQSRALPAASTSTERSESLTTHQTASELVGNNPDIIVETSSSPSLSKTQREEEEKIALHLRGGCIRCDLCKPLDCPVHRDWRLTRNLTYVGPCCGCYIPCTIS